MQVHFTKMHGLGNDFIVIDATQQPFQLNAQQIQQLADRHFGIGFDQLLVVEPASSDSMDFRYRIFNADGGEVEQCGNGARCFARFVHDTGLCDKSSIHVETKTGPIVLQLNDNGQITVNMGIPKLLPKDIPFIAAQQAVEYPLQVNNEEWRIGAVSMGNPHAVLLVDDVDSAPVESLGPVIESHPAFPKRVNVGFMQVVDRHHARLRVFERGVGETLACGTGACAAMVSGVLRGKLDSPAYIDLPGGTLTIEWPGPGQAVMMTGPASTVFTGQIDIHVE